MSASASASTSTNAASLSPSLPSSTASPSLPHSPETARQVAEARRALEASMNNIGSSLDSTLRSRAQNLHVNSAQLEKQQKEVVKETAALRKEADKLKKVADEGSRKVKELGNVQNWAEMLERDFLLLGETMRLVRDRDRQTGWEGREEGWETSSGSESFSETEEDGERLGEEQAVADERGTEAGNADLGKRQSNVDGEGDTAMHGLEEDESSNKRKEDKEVVVEQHTGSDSMKVEGSSTTARS